MGSSFWDVGRVPWARCQAPCLHPAVDEQNKQTQAYRASTVPSKKDSSEELNKEERLCKALCGTQHGFFFGGGAMGRAVGWAHSAATPPRPGSRRETVTSATSSILLERPDTFGSLQFPEEPSVL